MNEGANWSFLCNESGCLNKVNSISQYRLFKLGRKTRSVKKKAGTVRGLVTGAVDDALIDILKVGGLSFLNFIPNMTKTPREEIAVPSDLHVVNRGIQSEESRVSPLNLWSFIWLQNEVYSTRSVCLHRDLGSVVEI